VKRPQRFIWLDDVHEQMRGQQLSPVAGHLALTLGVHYMNGSDEAWPSQAQLAASTGHSRTMVQKGLRELRDCSLLDIQRGRPGSKAGNVYRIPKGS
jgi:hypothetical protein